MFEIISLAALSVFILVVIYMYIWLAAHIMSKIIEITVLSDCFITLLALMFFSFWVSVPLLAFVKLVRGGLVW
jgi:hypothetical protein